MARKVTSEIRNDIQEAYNINKSTVKDIAAVNGVSTSTVYRTLRKLQNAYDNEGDNSSYINRHSYLINSRRNNIVESSIPAPISIAKAREQTQSNIYDNFHRKAGMVLIPGASDVPGNTDPSREGYVPVDPLSMDASRKSNTNKSEEAMATGLQRAQNRVRRNRNLLVAGVVLAAGLGVYAFNPSNNQNKSSESKANTSNYRTQTDLTQPPQIPSQELPNMPVATTQSYVVTTQPADIPGNLTLADVVAGATTQPGRIIEPKTVSYSENGTLYITTLDDNGNPVTTQPSTAKKSLGEKIIDDLSIYGRHARDQGSRTVHGSLVKAVKSLDDVAVDFKGTKTEKFAVLETNDVKYGKNFFKNVGRFLGNTGKQIVNIGKSGVRTVMYAGGAAYGILDLATFDNLKDLNSEYHSVDPIMRPLLAGKGAVEVTKIPIHALNGLSGNEADNFVIPLMAAGTDITEAAKHGSQAILNTTRKPLYAITPKDRESRETLDQVLDVAISVPTEFGSNIVQGQGLSNTVDLNNSIRVKGRIGTYAEAAGTALWIDFLNDVASEKDHPSHHRNRVTGGESGGNGGTGLPTGGENTGATGGLGL